MQYKKGDKVTVVDRTSSCYGQVFEVTGVDGAYIELDELLFLPKHLAPADSWEGLHRGVVLTHKTTKDFQVTVMSRLEDDLFVCLNVGGQFPSTYTLANLKQYFTLPTQQEEFPKVGDKFFYVHQEGGAAARAVWNGDDWQKRIKSFLGVYRTAKEVDALVEKVRGVVK